MITPTLPLAPSSQTAATEPKVASSKLLPGQPKKQGSTEASFQDHLTEPKDLRGPAAETLRKAKAEPRPENSGKSKAESRRDERSFDQRPDPKSSSKNAAMTQNKESRQSPPTNSRAASSGSAGTTPAKGDKTGAVGPKAENQAAARPTSLVETNKGIKTPEAQPPEAGSDEISQEANPADSTKIEGTASPEKGAKEKVLTEEQQRLEAILALVGMQMTTLMDLPSLSLLTGRLENIMPGDIPGAITENPLIQNFVGSADPAKVVDQVKPLGQWLGEMGWSPQGLVVKDPEAFQELMETPISLRDLMQSLHVDVDRVIKEAQILQATLPMDGVAPYMERAQRLQEQNPKNPIEAGKNKGGIPNDSRDAMPFVMAAMGHAIAQQGGTAAATLSDPKVQVVDPRAAAMIERSLPSEGDSLWISTDDLPAGTMIPLSLAAELPQVVSPRAGAEAFAPVAVPQIPTQVPNVSTQAQILPPAVSLLMSQQTPAFATQDPLALMMQQNPGLIQTHLFHPQADVSARPEVQAPASMDLLQSLQAIQIQQDPKDLSTRESAMESLLAFAAAPEEVAEAILGVNSEKSEDQAFAEADDEASNAFAPNQTNNSNGAKAFSIEAPPEMNKTALPPAVAKDIFEKSSLLLKEGGGSMRIDLGSKELGSLNLAVEVKDKTVEIRILAPTQQARELLATELPKLREALQNQNLDLKKVEIGLGGGSSFAQTSSDGRSSSRRDEYQSFEDSSIRGVGGAQRMSRGYRQVSQVNSEESPRINHDGAIQVRV